MALGVNSSHSQLPTEQITRVLPCIAFRPDSFLDSLFDAERKSTKKIVVPSRSKLIE